MMYDFYTLTIILYIYTVIFFIGFKVLSIYTKKLINFYCFTVLIKICNFELYKSIKYGKNKYYYSNY